MDDIQKKSLEAFEEMLKSMDKKVLNNLIEEISNMDTLGEPTIAEYFNQIEGQFAHFYISDDVDDICSKNNIEQFRFFQDIIKTHKKVIVSETIERSFNISINHQNADGFYDTSTESKKSMKKNSLAA